MISDNEYSKGKKDNFENINLQDIEKELAPEKLKNLYGLSVYLKDFIHWQRKSRILENEQGNLIMKPGGDRIQFYYGDDSKLTQLFSQNFTRFYWEDPASPGYASIAHTFDGEDYQAQGDVYAVKNLGCGGVKSFNIPHPDGSERRLVYVSQESPEALLRHRGTGYIDDKGSCTIELPRHFVFTTEPEGEVTVNLTATESKQDLYVDNITKNEKVKVCGKSKSKFFFEIIAVRKGYLEFDCEPPAPKSEKRNNVII